MPGLLRAFALVALVLAVSFWAPRIRRPGLVLAIGLAAAVGCSRVYLGVHWATDVIGGWLMGAAWLVVVLTTAAHIPSTEGSGSLRVGPCGPSSSPP